jgi:lipopolysaccharide/colanic/teichoic acid biosynthesis glycosyltransferase
VSALISQRAFLLATDLSLVALATVFALVLRDNFEITLDQWMALIFCYLPVSLANAGAVFIAGRLDRGLWRHSSIVDYLHIVTLTTVAVLLSVGLAFAINRLDGIPRSLPILQIILIVGNLVSARVIVRLWFEKRGISALAADIRSDQTILIVGINAISDLFLRSVREYAPHYRVAGFLAVDSIDRGRTIQRNEVLGAVEDLHGVLESLHVHGIGVDSIVVTAPRRKLSQRAVDVLREVETSSDIVVEILSERLGFDNGSRPGSRPGCDAGSRNIAHRSHRYSTRIAEHGYWRLKRAVDFCGAMLLSMLFAPIVPMVAVVVALDVGFPVIFWQQRPGLHGTPFRLYKFRTMRASHDKHFNRVADESRLSFVGRFLRKLRLDELPQLYNVLIGDMSLVGPRPLLPHDQSNLSTRLSVRPGLTGWAQVNGGCIISRTDKEILDIWYINKASFILDIVILLRTVAMVVLGDRINVAAVNQAKHDLGKPNCQVMPVCSEKRDNDVGVNQDAPPISGKLRVSSAAAGIRD